MTKRNLLKFCLQVIYPIDFCSKVFFGIFCQGKYFLLFLAEFELFMFHNNNGKIQKKEKWPSGICWNSASKLSTLSISAQSAFIFSMEKKKKKKKNENIYFF